MSLAELAYDREKAVEYAHYWAYRRNPRYYDFQDLGGDCTNFASQCIYAGAGVMNYTPTFGWYYVNASNRAPSWTGVRYLYNFLVGNRGPGPYGAQVGQDEVMPGDICQLGTAAGEFYHCPVIVALDGGGGLGGIYVAAHTRDADRRPLSTYDPARVRFIHILGVRAETG